MPELPEVETVVRELRPLLQGKMIRTIEAVWPKTFENRCTRELSGQRIREVARKGKYIVLRLEQSDLVIHLRMTGQLALNTSLTRPLNHIRLIIHFDDGEQLLFNDIRKFGRVYHVCQAREILQRIGKDGLDPQWSDEEFYQMLQSHSVGIKSFLMSQKYISGLGNIYTDESLFRAAVHPLRLSSSLSRKEAQRLFESIRFILTQGVKNMGSTISDYRDAYGNPGKNQYYFKVYGREGQPCLICGTPIEKIKAAGRSTRFCPKCQPLR
jgi:formamidopyrimidine-DNA glycosylase